MTESKKAVMGIFAARVACERAANELIACGFSPADFSTLPPEPIASPAEGNDGASGFNDDIAAAAPGASLAATIASLGISPSEVPHCEARLQNGGILFCVYCNSERQIESAKKMLQQNGAEEIMEASEARVARKEREAETGAAGAS